MTIYVITKGSHADYRICTVTTDAERAEALCEAYTEEDEWAYVERYETDTIHDLALLRGCIPWRVAFTSLGEVWHVNKRPEDNIIPPNESRVKVIDYPQLITKGTKRLWIDVCAANKKDAIEIAKSTRLEWLKMNETKKETEK